MNTGRPGISTGQPVAGSGLRETREATRSVHDIPPTLTVQFLGAAGWAFVGVWRETSRA